MTLAALSSNSLLDRGTDDSAVSQTELDEMIKRTGFEAARLINIMRSSKNIAAATSPASYNATQTDRAYKIQEKISPGSSSTVPGTRPKAWVYKDTDDDTDHTKLAGFVTQYLRTVDTERLKCVVLTDFNISPRQLRGGLSTPVSCFHAGVEMFNEDDNPIYREDRACDVGEAELTAWLRAKGGVLVTSEVQFRGAECDSVIFVTRHWGGNISSMRSPVTRAVAGLLMITSDGELSVRELRRDWEVKILEEGVWESDSETEDSETEDEDSETEDSDE